MTQGMKVVIPALLGAVGALFATPLADAQQAAPASAADPVAIWSIQDENASISTAKVTDRYYTNGLRLGWTSGTDSVPDFLAWAGQALWGDGQQRISFNLSQQIYTPFNTTVRQPPAGDSPYAGILMGTFSLLQDTDTSRSMLGLGLGVVGPWALGEQVQNGFHDLIGQDHNAGWHTQLHNEPAFEVTTGRVWRLPIASFNGLDIDALPEITAGVGNVRVYAESGVVFRLGQGLDSDFGVARIRPGMSGDDAFRPTRPFAWYVFAGADGQGVAHDLTVQGSTWQDSYGQKLKPLVGEFEGGLAVMVYGARLTYTHVVDTQQAQHQKGGLHQLGSLALSVRF
jgi:hypothetical protein